MPENERDTVTAAIAAIHAGDKETGRELILALLEDDPRNEAAGAGPATYLKPRRDASTA